MNHNHEQCEYSNDFNDNDDEVEFDEPPNDEDGESTSEGCFVDDTECDYSQNNNLNPTTTTTNPSLSTPIFTKTMRQHPKMIYGGEAYTLDNMHRIKGTSRNWKCVLYKIKCPGRAITDGFNGPVKLTKEHNHPPSSLMIDTTNKSATVRVKRRAADSSTAETTNLSSHNGIESLVDSSLRRER